MAMNVPDMLNFGSHIFMKPLHTTIKTFNDNRPMALLSKHENSNVFYYIIIVKVRQVFSSSLL